ncbi:hypothetical protein WR25_19622 [Diploscapter pachys]|uniref:SKI/SNO/DAC domain-containing protein n=1 Tax=Diploscapter pachys TaxID=2018661 RepID=A0A2A2JTV4_9BILA|nr:hypothetical protein WR25_19622 [Diploscapter pachys]
MESLLAIQRLAELQAKFSDCPFAFDAESLLAMAHKEQELPPISNGNNNSSSDSSVSGSLSDNSLEANGAASNGGSVIGGGGELLNAKIVDYRGHKVAGFEIDGKNMICLPQVYELFLKNMVGGLHTVYTKLKRLEVRTLRSCGAIQPGVNRCKLIEISDFEKLLEDCTNTCTRPGRPPKRYSTEEWMTLTTVNGKQAKYDSGSENGNGNLTPTGVALGLHNSTTAPVLSALDHRVSSVAALLSDDSSHSSPCLLPSSAAPLPTLPASACSSNPLLFSHLISPLAVQQLLMQHMINFGDTHRQKQRQTNEDVELNGCTQTTTTSNIEISSENSNSSEQLTEDKDEESEENPEGSQPLNLTKNGSEPSSDNDSLENTKELSPNQSITITERGSSSSGSNNSPDESRAAVEKMVDLIEMARDIFKVQKEDIQKEKDEFTELRNTLKDAICGEEKLRIELEKERKKSRKLKNAFKR